MSYTHSAMHRRPDRLLQGASILIMLLALCCSARADDNLIDYLDRYHRLAEKDVQSRLDLADWCRSRQLYQQQADLLAEVLKLQPGHITAYRDLIDADARRTRSIDKQWAAKLEGLVDSRFHLYHTAHFTILYDASESAALAQAQGMEDSYATFYHEAIAIGLQPMPPPGRLVCVLFKKYDDYRNYLVNYEGSGVSWAAGFYSWRTNRAAFFHDHDNPAFQDVRDQIADAENRIAELRPQLQSARNIADQIKIQTQLKHLNANLTDMNSRLDAASNLSTLGKSRHEAAHQILFNSGLQRRGRDYPFWLSEGLATQFELCDAKGHASPRFVNTHRLATYRDAQKDNKLLSLSDFFHERLADEMEPRDVARCYAQSWALLNFLWNKHPHELRAFLDALETQGSPRNWLIFFKTHFGEDIDGLDREMRRYIDSLELGK